MTGRSKRQRVNSKWATTCLDTRRTNCHYGGTQGGQYSVEVMLDSSLEFRGSRGGTASDWCRRGLVLFAHIKPTPLFSGPDGSPNFTYANPLLAELLTQRTPSRIYALSTCHPPPKPQTPHGERKDPAEISSGLDCVMGLYPCPSNRNKTRRKGRNGDE